MRNVIAKAVVLIVAGFVAAPAAMPSEKEMRANIPFAFLAGDQMQPAGDYYIQVNSDFRYVNLRPVNSATARRVALSGNFVERIGRDRTRGFLRFERYGSTYALRAVGVGEAEDGLGLLLSGAEKELAKTNGRAVGVEVNLM